jgi:hypothetical protein
MENRFYLPKDCLTHIFSYLSATDIISCSLVSHDWYMASSDNYNWFKLCKEGIQKVYHDLERYDKTKNLKNLDYCSKVNWKLFYLGIFHHRYDSQIISCYKQFGRDVKNMMKIDLLSGVLISCLIVIPCSIIAFPLSIGLEIYTLIKHSRNKMETCNCESCLYKPLFKGNKLLKYYRQ